MAGERLAFDVEQPPLLWAQAFQMDEVSEVRALRDNDGGASHPNADGDRGGHPTARDEGIPPADRGNDDEDAETSGHEHPSEVEADAHAGNLSQAGCLARWSERGYLAMAAVVAVPASAAARFDGERPAGSDIDPKHQSDWEPTVAVDPDHANRIYQLITGINAKACQNCPGTSVLFRRSTDGGATFGRESFVCATACKTIGWQFDPRIRRSVQGRGRVHVHRR